MNWFRKLIFPCEYVVLKDGDTAWSHRTRKYKGLEHFPREYTDRPDTGEVVLKVNGEVIAVNIPLEGGES